MLSRCWHYSARHASRWTHCCHRTAKLHIFSIPHWSCMLSSIRDHKMPRSGSASVCR